MIKKKTEDIQEIISIINSKYGSGLIKSATEKIERIPENIDFSPAHNIGIGGPGIPKGSWVILGGPPKTCKTTTALHLAKKCQRNGMKIRYLNIEGRIKKRDIESMEGIDANELLVIESSQEKILMGDDFLNIAQDILKYEDNICLIIDSFSDLIDRTEYENGIGTSTRGGAQKNAYQFCRNMSNVVNIKENIVVAISQVMANTSGYGATRIEKGGYGIKYKADIKLMVKSAKDIEVDGRIVGKEVDWEVDATPFNQPPAVKYTSIVRYGIGIDEIQELINIAIDTGIIEKGGAWYNYDGNKYQGMEKLRLAISESKELQDKLTTELKECLQ